MRSAKTQADVDYVMQLLQWSNYVPTIQANLTTNPPDEEGIRYVMGQCDRATAVLEDARPPASAATAHALLLKTWLDGKADLLEMQKAIEATPADDYTASLLSFLTRP
jgi:hypothetical protein